MEETQSQRWNKNNREKRNKISRDYRQRNLEQLRLRDIDRDLKRAYGISLEEYTAMEIAQNKQCKICGTSSFYGRTRFAVDHCHETGKVRGLLCTKCNAGLGMFEDNPERLISALSYLKEYN